MGCDIHLFVEKRKKDSKDDFLPCAFRSEFSERTYSMFAKLANVRNYDKVEHLPIRGLPEDISYITFEALYKKVIFDPINEWDEENCYTIDQVNKWVKDGYSHVIHKHEKEWCSNPDAHSYNWCTSQEIMECLTEFTTGENHKYRGNYLNWVGLAAYMKALEDNGNYEVRAAYWFDN